MHPNAQLDPALRDFTTTDRQREIFDAVVRHGGMRPAARALDVAYNNVFECITDLKAKAASMGYAPGHWTAGVAPGYRMGKVTVQRTPAGVERVWERQHPEAVSLEAIIDRCEERLKAFPRLKILAAPKPVSAPLTNFLGLFDLHIGEKISADDPAGCWDIAIARRTIVDCATHAILTAPKAKRLVLCFGGDAAHYDGLEPVRRLCTEQGSDQSARLHDAYLS